MSHITLIRHGQANSEAKDEISYDKLSPLGHEQAAWLGDHLRHSLPGLAAFGAALVLACDILGRVIWYPYEIPVGTILGVVGAAVFLWLLQGRRAHAA